MKLEGIADAPHDIPLDQLDVSNPVLFKKNVVGQYFSRLRREDPVHYCSGSPYGPYWSVTKFNDIMRVDTDHKTFSSEAKLGPVDIVDSRELRTLIQGCLLEAGLGAGRSDGAGVGDHRGAAAA